MSSLANGVRNFMRGREGPTAIEYAIVLTLIIIMALASITPLGTQVNQIFTDVASGIPTGTRL